jgi:hypothetical protein
MRQQRTELAQARLDFQAATALRRLVFDFERFTT